MASESVFVLLGSNLGDRQLLVNQACRMMEERCGKIVAKSRLYESEPWGFKSEHWFLNQVVEISTSLSPDELMDTLLLIEKELGRDRSTPHEGYVSRPMDLDILYWGDGLIADGQHVIVPHPRLHLRRFTLLPLCDVAPDYVHPILKKTNRQLLDECQDQGVVKML
ncbi:MAG: 2-amino-4-hydroxy-6-hydroxymethyldihydropteridine diphosphokinase [Bacteroidales bacterium]|nr:2-amino-4-hydroxy-6-hydroxymethyldihydropteridine diphosphokinase [Bacteroidales bacterium]